jgi:hypothetical protein
MKKTTNTIIGVCMVAILVAYFVNRNKDKRVPTPYESKAIKYADKMDSLRIESEKELVASKVENELLKEALKQVATQKEITRLSLDLSTDSMFVSVKERSCLRDSLKLKYRL